MGAAYVELPDVPSRRIRMPTKRKSTRELKLWDYVRRDGRDSLYQITAIDAERGTCSLTLIHAGQDTNLVFHRIPLNTLTRTEK